VSKTDRVFKIASILSPLLWSGSPKYALGALVVEVDIIKVPFPNTTILGAMDLLPNTTTGYVWSLGLMKAVPVSFEDAVVVFVLYPSNAEFWPWPAEEFAPNDEGPPSRIIRERCSVQVSIASTKRWLLTLTSEEVVPIGTGFESTTGVCQNENANALENLGSIT
jgi:hypothetical protein